MLLPGAVTSPTPAEDEVGLLTVLGAGLLGALLMLITIGQYMSDIVAKNGQKWQKKNSTIEQKQNKTRKIGVTRLWPH